MVTPLMTSTLPTIIGMGVVAQTTQAMFGKGRSKGKQKKRKFKIYQGKRGGQYVIRKGRKVYI